MQVRTIDHRTMFLSLCFLDACVRSEANNPKVDRGGRTRTPGSLDSWPHKASCGFAGFLAAQSTEALTPGLL
jgi:hypothetical protein